MELKGFNRIVEDFTFLYIELLQIECECVFDIGNWKNRNLFDYISLFISVIIFVIVDVFLFPLFVVTLLYYALNKVIKYCLETEVNYDED